jgi:phenylacetate-CoA ligase
MPSLLDKIYSRAPVVAQNAMVTAFGARWYLRRFGPGYHRELRGFVERTRSSASEWRAYQTAALRELITLASHRIPYYQRAWRGLGLDAGSISRFTLEDLASLPIVEKEATRSEPEAFCVDGHAPPSSVITPTSGSTGTPVRVYFTTSEFRRSLALREARGCRPAGVSYRLPRATFSGRLVVPDARSLGPFHRFNLVERQVYFSAFHLSPRNAAAYVAPLRDHRIVWGTGYSHAWEQLAGFMLEQGIAPVATLRAIITTSEKLTSAARAKIERAFGCRVYEEYGTVEDAVYACEHPDGKLRLSPDAGILELQRPDGTIVEQGSPDEGQTITTSFMRRGQLFIRYRLGDVASWDPSPDTTGLHMPVLREIAGRVEDVIEGLDGRRTVRFHGIFTEMEGVREAQVIQEARDLICIKVVPAKEFNDATCAEIVRRVQARLTTGMRVEVQTVEEIPRTKAGKFQAVINRVPK